MNYQNITTDEIKSYYTLKSDNPNVSMAPDGTTEILDWHVIASTPKPAYDKYTKGVREIAPVGYVQTWEEYDLDAAEVERLLDRSKGIKIREIWSLANGNIDVYSKGVLGGSNPDKKGKLTHDNQRRSNKRLDGGTLTTEETTEQVDYDGFLTFCEQTEDAANTQEVIVEVLTSAANVEAVTVDDGSYPVNPYSSLDRVARKLLINELVDQSTVNFIDYDQVDQDGMNDFIDSGVKYILIGSYIDMPHGRELYNSINESINNLPIETMITNHMAAGTYFDNNSQTFKL